MFYVIGTSHLFSENPGGDLFADVAGCQGAAGERGVAVLLRVRRGRPPPEAAQLHPQSEIRQRHEDRQDGGGPAHLRLEGEGQRRVGRARVYRGVSGL